MVHPMIKKTGAMKSNSEIRPVVRLHWWLERRRVFSSASAG